MEALAVIRQAGETKPYHVVGDLVTPLLSQDGVEMFDASGAINSGPPLHSHPWTESYVIIDGRLEVQVGDEHDEAGPGAVVSIPADVPHAYRIASDSARFLVITSPAGADTFFREIDENVKDMSTDMAMLLAIAARNGVELRGPGLAPAS